jgi:hypothetical protein
MTVLNALRVVRASAIYDLLVTAGFALAVTAAPLLTSLGALHERLGLTGSVPDARDPFTLMFANLMGSVVIVWALFRLVRPSLLAGAADVVARLLFSLGMLSALVAGASSLVVVMLVLEIAWALVQGGALLAVRRGGVAARWAGKPRPSVSSDPSRSPAGATHGAAASPRRQAGSSRGSAGSSRGSAGLSRGPAGAPRRPAGS